MKKLLWIVLLFTAMLEIKAQTNIYSLDFDPEKYSVQTFTFDEKEYKVRAYENIVYVENQIDTTYQKINIYVREEQFSDQKINGFDKETAPVFLPNGVGGYMPSQPLTLNRSNRNIFGIEQRGQRQMPPQAPQGDTKQDAIPNKAIGLIHKYHEVLIDIQDEAGSIATVATLLSTNAINMKNIGIHHNREFQDGVLRIEFYDEVSANKATKLLENHNYQIGRAHV